MAGKGLGERDKAHLQCLFPVALFVCQGSDILLIFLWFQPVPERCSETRDVTVHLGCRLWWSLWMYLLYLFQKFFFTCSGGCWSFLWQVGGQSRNASSRYISDSSAAVPLAFTSAVGDYSGDRQFGGGNVASVLNTQDRIPLNFSELTRYLNWFPGCIGPYRSQPSPDHTFDWEAGMSSWW